MEYTKGEWKARAYGDGRWYIDSENTQIAEVHHYLTHHRATEANARLITQAPRMYEALKQIQRWLLEGTEIEGGKAKLFNTQFVKANNLTVRAIAKVEGGK